MGCARAHLAMLPSVGWGPAGLQGPAAVVLKAGIDSGCAEPAGAEAAAAAQGDAHMEETWPVPTTLRINIYIFPFTYIFFPYVVGFLFFPGVLMQFISTVTEVLWMLIGNSITFLCVLGYLSRLLLGLSCKSSGKNVKEEIMCVCVCTGAQSRDPSAHESGNCSLFSREMGCRYEEALGAMSGTYCFIHGLSAPPSWFCRGDEQMLRLRGAVGYQHIPQQRFSTGICRNLRLRLVAPGWIGVWVPSLGAGAVPGTH